MTQTVSSSASLALAVSPSRATLHFGLRWAPLIGSRPAQLARRRAQMARASHYIYCGERGVALAFARFARTPRHWRHFSAAAIFAAHHPTGALVWTTSLPDGRFWLVGARDGAVLTRTDRLFDTWDHLHQALDQLVMDDPGLVVLSTHDWPVLEASPTAEARATADGAADTQSAASLPQRLLSCADRTSPMHALPWTSRVAGPWWMAMLLVSASAMYMWVTRTPELGLHAQGAQPPDLPVIDPAELRARAIQEGVRSQWAGANHYAPVLSELRALPVVLDGWRIAGARCDWAMPAWLCTADYQRDLPGATNIDLLRNVPSDRHVRFTPFSVGHVSWVVAAESTPLAIERFLAPAWVDASLVSALQSRAPAFVHMTLGPRIELDLVAATLIAPGGSDAPPVPSLPARRALIVEGPLRSFGVLDDLAAHVAWDQIILRFQQGVTPALSQSALQVALRGWVHEK